MSADRHGAGTFPAHGEVPRLGDARTGRKPPLQQLPRDARRDRGQARCETHTALRLRMPHRTVGEALTDTVSPKVRSKIMRSVKSTSQLEIQARPYLETIYGPGILHHAKPDGYPYMPDYYEPNTKTIIFINGCFWHGCDLHYKPPETRKEYWERKVAANRRRDAVAWLAALYRGYRLHVAWEHEFKTPDFQSTVPAEPNGLSAEKGENGHMAPCLRADDKKLGLAVADNARKAAEKMIDKAQAERGAGNVADWVGESLRTGRANLRQAMKLKERLKATPECK